MMPEAIGALAVASAFAAGGFLGRVGYSRGVDAKRRRAALQAMGCDSVLEAASVSLESAGLSAWVISWMVSLSRRNGFTEGALLRIASRGYSSDCDLAIKSGLSQAVTKEGFAATRLYCSALAGLCGALAGCVFSSTLMLIGLALGAILGWRAPIGALRDEVSCRSFSAERQLSQMIEVVVLGLRSGMSFDRALGLYHGSFEGSLSAALALAQQQWSHNLIDRQEGLRNVSRSYDSPLFERFAENVIRSLRFGTSLAGSLGLLAVEARAIRKAKLEEQVAKAPVKMLLPVGALILPAMLVLIMGPIMLDLMNGF